MLFSKSKTQPEDNTMFSMERIGANLMKYRKAAGITQMELADKMGISFQAVSNWERGVSCPDIARLAELSELYGVSIDEILGNKRAAKIATKLQNNEIPDLNIEEISEVAPLLKQEQTDKIVEKALSSHSDLSKSSEPDTAKPEEVPPPVKQAQTENTTEKSNIDIKEVAKVAPFLSQDFIDEIAKKRLDETNDAKSIADIIPFVSEDIIDEFVLKSYRETGSTKSFAGILPFVFEDTIDMIAQDRLEKTNDGNSISDIIAFVSEDIIDEFAMKCYRETDDLKRIAGITPFISEDVINEIARQALQKHGLSGVAPILPFIDSEVLEDYISKK